MKLKLHFKCRRCGHVKVSKIDHPLIERIETLGMLAPDFLNWKEMHDCIDGTGIYGIADMIGVQPHDPSTDPA